MNATQDEPESRERLVRLLDYLEQIEKLNVKPATTIPRDFFVLAEAEARGLWSARLNLVAGNETCWLRLPRIDPISPPALLPSISAWVDLSNSPNVAPALRPEVIVEVDGVQVKRKLVDEPQVQPLFEQYLHHLWMPWSATERVRREAQAVYQKLFSLYQRMSDSLGSDSIELVWGIGHTVWQPKPGHLVSHPLITVQCEIVMDIKSGALDVRPGSKPPSLELDAFAHYQLLEGVTALESYWQGLGADARGDLDPFDEKGLETLFEAASSMLQRDGAYRGGTVALPAATEQVQVTSAWALFARKRRSEVFLADLRRLRDQVERVERLPAVARALVTRGGIRDDDGQDVVEFRGVGNSNAGPEARELYFPLPYNDEQMAIAKSLATNSGVVVQGPPGTGKTWTIANIISDYLARGKRVLVTSHGESALSVLKEKLPVQIQSLAVALLAGEREGMQQFEHSIRQIAEGVGQLEPAAAARRVEDAEARIQRRHAEIVDLDASIADLANRHLQEYPYRDQRLMPKDLARKLIEGAELFSWFEDALPKDASAEAPISDERIAMLREARAKLGGDIGLLADRLIDPETLPGAESVSTWHQALVAAGAVDSAVSTGKLIAVRLANGLGDAEAEKAAATLRRRRDLHAQLSAVPGDWVWPLVSRISELDIGDPAFEAVLQLGRAAADLAAERRRHLPLAVEAPPGAESMPEVMKAVSRGMDGQKPFPLPFLQGVARRTVEEMRVAGKPPVTREDWASIAAVLQWRQSALGLPPRWRPLAAEFGLPNLAAGDEAECVTSLVEIDATVRKARSWIHEFTRPLKALFESVFGSASTYRLMASGEDGLKLAEESLSAYLDRSRLAHARAAVEAAVREQTGARGDLADKLRRYLGGAVGDPSISGGAISAGWLALTTEIRRVWPLRTELQLVREITAEIASAGAPAWAKRLQSEAAGGTDVALPGNWRQAWEWRYYQQMLDSIDGHKPLRELFEKRRQAAKQLGQAYQDVVAERTWLKLKQDLSAREDVMQALRGYLLAVGAMAKSPTAKGNARHLRHARTAMADAYSAVPCWILPHWRVSEAVPAVLGLFDLVILDEASQSGLEALPALLRAKQLLVVGDDKQVSPSSVGLEVKQLEDLERRYLVDQPHGAAMGADRPIYDLAQRVFAAQTIVLKEHFRCVRPIIEYSNREFYNHEIRPLRVPAAHERLDPPLIDVYVRGGSRKGDVNEVEAEAVMMMLDQIIEDPTQSHRSLGVVTLHGHEQAQLLNTLISQRIPTTEIVKRQLIAGAPPTFQGRERDIILVSMVHGAANRGADDSRASRQRFNVAFSRARDRMILFRSFREEDRGPETLTGKVLAHFRQPFRIDHEDSGRRRERCESDFEKEIFDELVQRGYRVTPQVRSGSFRIDLVVEGLEGRRLAVECDGDRYHGPDRWGDDMARQRVLERAGWRFWRCFASSFVRRRTEVLNDLFGTLESLGIEPIGDEDVDVSAWSASIVMDPLGLGDDHDAAAMQGLGDGSSVAGSLGTAGNGV